MPTDPPPPTTGRGSPISPGDLVITLPHAPIYPHHFTNTPSNKSQHSTALILDYNDSYALVLLPDSSLGWIHTGALTHLRKKEHEDAKKTEKKTE
jgi:hypothetical protein